SCQGGPAVGVALLTHEPLRSGGVVAVAPDPKVTVTRPPAAAVRLRTTPTATWGPVPLCSVVPLARGASEIDTPCTPVEQWGRRGLAPPTATTFTRVAAPDPLTDSRTGVGTHEPAADELAWPPTDASTASTYARHAPSWFL